MEYIKIKDILSFQKKSKIKASEGLKIGKYNFYTSSKEQNKFLDYYEYSNESLIIGTGGNANLHHSYGKFSVSTDCFVLESKDKNFLVEFIYRYLLKNINILENGFRGAGLKHISKEYLENIKIPIISLEKQKMIIKILKNIDIFIDKNKQIKNELSFLNKSLFTTMFGDIKTNDKNWEIYYWKDVLNIKNGKNQKQVEDINGKYPIYGSGGIIGRSNAYICNENSIIIGRKGNINKPILVKEKFWNVDTAFGLEVKSEKMSYHYLYYFCLFYDFEIHNKAVTIPSLVKSDLEKIVLPVPPIELQNKFAERVEKIEKLSFNLY